MRNTDLEFLKKIMAEIELISGYALKSTELNMGISNCTYRLLQLVKERVALMAEETKS